MNKQLQQSIDDLIIVSRALNAVIDNLCKVSQEQALQEISDFGQLQDRQWFGLTNEEIDPLFDLAIDRLDFARAIEAKLKEKNNEHICP